jgi:hypothetical protein
MPPKKRTPKSGANIGAVTGILLICSVISDIHENFTTNYGNEFGPGCKWEQKHFKANRRKTITITKPPIYVQPNFSAPPMYEHLHPLNQHQNLNNISANNNHITNDEINLLTQYRRAMMQVDNKNLVQQNIPLPISTGIADTDSKPTILTRAPLVYAPESNMVNLSRSPPPPPNQHLSVTAATVTPSTTRVAVNNMVDSSRSPPPPNQHLLATAATVTPSTTRDADNNLALPLVQDAFDPLPAVRIVISPADSLRLEIESHGKHAKSCESLEAKTNAEILASSQQKEKEELFIKQKQADEMLQKELEAATLAAAAAASRKVASAHEVVANEVAASTLLENQLLVAPATAAAAAVM